MARALNGPDIEILSLGSVLQSTYNRLNILVGVHQSGIPVWK